MFNVACPVFNWFPHGMRNASELRARRGRYSAGLPLQVDSGAGHGWSGNRQERVPGLAFAASCPVAASCPAQAEQPPVPPDFAEFLTESTRSREDWYIDARSCHRRVADQLMAEYADSWDVCEDEYALSHVVTHLIAARAHSPVAGTCSAIRGSA